MDEETSTGSVPSRGQRARLTCAECHRRKTKCDKNVPCGTCTKRYLFLSTCMIHSNGSLRGIAHLCNREEASRGATRPPSEESERVQTLLERVANLEGQLRLVQTAPPINPASINNHNSLDVSGQVNEEVNSSSDSTSCETTTVLEFLAWGRKKNVDFANEPEQNSGPGYAAHDMSTTDFLTESTKSAQLDMLETLLPTKNIVQKLVGYHNGSILWYHGSYSSKIFSDQLSSFFLDFEGNIRHDQLNFQWLALLFAILTGSLTCASKATCHEWGFSELETKSLSLRWYDATVTCLNMADYAEIHTIHSIQAIATLTIAAHVLGKSSSQSVLLASAGRIAQSLGLHRLVPETTTSDFDRLRKLEAGRRVFIQLCTQDWFQIPFSDTYTHNPKFATTTKPLNCNDDDMIVRDSSIPTQASYCNFRYDIAALMPELLDAMAGCNTLYTKYEQVMKYDAKMRDLATSSIPIFLSKNGPVDAEWPRHISWARRSLTICACE